MTDEQTQSAQSQPAACAPGKHLDPVKLEFFWQGSNLCLTIEGQCTCLNTRIVRAFPLTDPNRYLSVRNAKNEEIGMIGSLESLDSAMRELLEKDLVRRYILPQIKAIHRIKDQFGFMEWTVSTNIGKRKFSTRDLRENARRPSPTRIFITDNDGNRYEIPDTTRLDQKSLALLFQYL